MKDKKVTLSNLEIALLALYLIGGDKNYVDTEDIAIEANRIAPGRFAWRKYPEQINLRLVEIRLCEGRNPRKGGYIIGSMKNGWILSQKGLQFVKTCIQQAQIEDLSRTPMSEKEKAYYRSEKERMLASVAYHKIKLDQADKITPPEADMFFRLDEYIIGLARKEKIMRVTNAFSNIAELAEAIKIVSKKVRKL